MMHCRNALCIKTLLVIASEYATKVEMSFFSFFASKKGEFTALKTEECCLLHVRHLWWPSYSNYGNKFFCDCDSDKAHTNELRSDETQKSSTRNDKTSAHEHIYFFFRKRIISLWATMVSTKRNSNKNVKNENYLALEFRKWIYGRFSLSISLSLPLIRSFSFSFVAIVLCSVFEDQELL